jgi:hypothetical protein
MLQSTVFMAQSQSQPPGEKVSDVTKYTGRYKRKKIRLIVKEGDIMS